MEGRWCCLVGSSTPEFFWNNWVKPPRTLYVRSLYPVLNLVLPNYETILLSRDPFSWSGCPPTRGCVWGKRDVVWRMHGNYHVFPTHVYGVIKHGGMWVLYRHFACRSAAVNECHKQWHNEILLRHSLTPAVTLRCHSLELLIHAQYVLLSLANKSFLIYLA